MSKRKRKNSIEVLENMREKDKEKVNDMKIKEMVAQEEIIQPPYGSPQPCQHGEHTVGIRPLTREQYIHARCNHHEHTAQVQGAIRSSEGTRSHTAAIHGSTANQ